MKGMTNEKLSGSTGSAAFFSLMYLIYPSSLLSYYGPQIFEAWVRLQSQAAET
jgi:hypothetical protein